MPLGSCYSCPGKKLCFLLLGVVLGEVTHAQRKRATVDSEAEASRDFARWVKKLFPICSIFESSFGP